MSSNPRGSSSYKGKLLSVEAVKTERKNIWECDLCGRKVDRPWKIQGGGRVTFCRECMRKLEKAGHLECKKNRIVELKDNLLETLTDYPSL